MTATVDPATQALQQSGEPLPRTTAPFPPGLDISKMQAFMAKIMSDMSGALASFMCTLGDRLGLFKDLAMMGPATSVELADRTGTHERYVREWLSALASAGYLDYDQATQRFSLPPEHALAVAAEGSPMFMGGAYQQLVGLLGPFDQLAHAFRYGGGVPQEAYDDNLREGMERVSAGWFDHLLVQQWIPLVPDVQAKLASGAYVADIGCGSGRALIRLAQAFPNSRYVGYDKFGPTIVRAIANAEKYGVGDRVRFEQRDVVDGLPEQYDLITTFDAVHDFSDPRAGLQTIRQALVPDGTYLLLEMNCSNKLEENVGPAAVILYGTSVLYNTPVSLADGGIALGTMGLPESEVRKLCAEAGFGSVRRLPMQNPFNILYAVKL